MQFFSKTRVDYFADPLVIGVGQAAKFIKRATDERVIIATRAPRLLRCMSLALALSGNPETSAICPLWVQSGQHLLILSFSAFDPSVDI